MTRHVENNSRYTWVNNLLNNSFFCVDEEKMKSFGIAWGAKNEDGKWSWKLRRAPNDVQFYNAILFCRINWPYPGVFIGARWSGSETRKALLQTGIGWKLLGRISAIFRIQSDASSEAGYNSPNIGQSKGWNYGPH